jgi:histone acetyltransferase (RNA polymerase elongator complex component)
MAGEIPSPSQVREFIEASLSKLPSGHSENERQVAFYGASFTAMSQESQIAYLETVQSYLFSGAIRSLRISTRPDALTKDVLDLLKTYHVKTVEIGVQSMNDHVLALAKRGHCAEDSAAATSRLKDWGFEVGLQLMIGLPGDSLGGFLHTVDRVIDLRPDFVRIHPTLVFRGSFLELLWRQENYSPLSLDETVVWLKRGILKLERAFIPVARIGLQPTKELEEHFLAGPYHPSLRHVVDSAIAFDMALHLLTNTSRKSSVRFLCHPRDISTLRGQKNANVRSLKERFQLREFVCEGNTTIPRGSLGLEASGGLTFVHRKDLRYHEN